MAIPTWGRRSLLRFYTTHDALLLSDYADGNRHQQNI